MPATAPASGPVGIVVGPPGEQVILPGGVELPRWGVWVGLGAVVLLVGFLFMRR